MNGFEGLTPEELQKKLEEMAAGSGKGELPTLPAEVISITKGVLPAGQPLTEQLYRALLEQLPAVTFMTSFEEKEQTVYVSPQIQDILGYTPEEWLASPALWYERLHEEDRERWEKEFSDTVMSKGTAVRSAYRFLHKDGRVVWILGDVHIRRDASGGMLFVQAVGFDITDLKRKEEELEAAKEELRKSNVHLRVQVKKEMVEGLVGASPTMAKLRDKIRLFARSSSNVLITGESGSGKELVARALHYGGPRAKKPFVAVNCAAIPESLLESELFGHEKGAFTGATEKRVGRFEQADGGTIFLDEIGDMPLSLQPKVLRVLDDGKITPVGGGDRGVQVRVVCATNRNPVEMIEKGSFRADLYYRISTVPIAVPPLRERLEDVPDLAQHLLARKNLKEKRDVRISGEAVEILRGQTWPGNVRELLGAIEYAVDVCEDVVILPEHLPAWLQKRAPAQPEEREDGRLDDKLERLERREILAALEECGWVYAQAARKLGMSPPTLMNRMAKLRIRRGA